MLNYENEIMNLLKGETPKQKYDALKASIDAKNINEGEMRKLAFDFLEGDEFTSGFPDDWDGCVYITAQFGNYIKNLL
jgi:hypothetical protein